MDKHGSRTFRPIFLSGPRLHDFCVLLRLSKFALPYENVLIRGCEELRNQHF